VVTATLADLRELVTTSTPSELATFIESLPPEDIAAVEAAVADVTGRRSYRDDPVRWVLECIDWKDGEGPTQYQLRILEAVRVHKRVAVRSLHGIGKTTVEAWIFLWFATTRDGDDIDWKAVTTAGVWRQLSKYLWPEIHKWAKRLRWDRLGRSAFVRKVELLDLALKLDDGEGFAVASDDPQKIEGVHADAVLYLYDEAKAIGADTFDASEGAFAGAGDDTPREAYALAMSTPGAPFGRFADIHHRKSGFEDWHVIHVTLADAIESGRVSLQWADRMARQWGVESAVYKNRVLGDFAAEDEDGVIPLAWIEAANERWLAWRDNPKASGLPTALGVDVAHYGTDSTALALRCGPVVARIDSHQRVSTTHTVGLVQSCVLRWPQTLTLVIVDSIGVGAGVYDQLSEWGAPVLGFVASESTDLRDRSGQFGFRNKRSAAWWRMRELLDPAYDSQIALPPDDELTGDLVTPHWRIVTGGQIAVESTDDIRSRLGRSPDKGTAVVQSFWMDGGPLLPVQAPKDRARERRHSDELGMLDDLDDRDVLSMGF
jgi:hypothetical protein